MENYYQFTKKMIFSIGVDFDKQEKYKFLLKILRNISIAFTVLNLIHSLMYFATSNKKDYHNISSVSMTIFGLQSLIKIFVVCYYRDSFVDIIERIKSRFEKHDEHEKEKSWSFLKRTRKFLVNWFLAQMVCLWSFNLLPLLTMVIGFFSKGILLKTFPYGYWFPFDTDRYYFIVFCYQLYAGHVIIAIQMIMDQLFLLISAEIKTQFDRLGDRISKIINNTDPKESVNTKKELNEFIDSHNDLISIFNDFNDVYTGAVLFDVVTMAVGICFVGVMTMNLDLAHAIPSALGLILSVGKMFILCWFGNMISDSAGRIADEVYGSNFLNLNNSLRKDLLIIIQMSQKPRTISVRNVFSLKLSAFSNIIRTAFSYFALAREFF